MKIKAQQSVMYCLAGFAAESRVEYFLPSLAEIRSENDQFLASYGMVHNTPYWFDDLLQRQEGEFEEEDDFNLAVSTANALYGDTMQGQFLHRMAVWTDEALSHPRLWAVVESLAERLQTIKTRLSAESAIRIMSNAWGDPSGLPYMQMGRKWRRLLLED